MKDNETLIQVNKILDNRLNYTERMLIELLASDLPKVSIYFMKLKLDKKIKVLKERIQQNKNKMEEVK